MSRLADLRPARPGGDPAKACCPAAGAPAGRMAANPPDRCRRDEAAIDYTQPIPVAAARAQAFYGMEMTPQLADGRVPLRLALLSPAGRPVAITGDLAGFWREAGPTCGGTCWVAIRSTPGRKIRAERALSKVTAAILVATATACHVLLKQSHRETPVLMTWRRLPTRRPRIRSAVSGPIDQRLQWHAGQCRGPLDTGKLCPAGKAGPARGGEHCGDRNRHRRRCACRAATRNCGIPRSAANFAAASATGANRRWGPARASSSIRRG